MIEPIHLFTPFKTLSLKNRAVMAPMTRFSCHTDGTPTAELAEYYIERAKNDVALIIIESCAVNDTDACGYVDGAQFHSEIHVDAWKPIIKEIHAHGAKVWLQLFHAGRLTVKEVCGDIPLAPSVIPPFNRPSFWRPEVDGEVVNFQTQTPYLAPKEISVDEIQRIEKEFANACELAMLAGFDGIEIHGAHGYLVHEFCHQTTNMRSDIYSASPNYLFPIELVTACKRYMPSDKVLSYRLSTHMVDNTYIRYNDNEMDFPKLVRELDKAGVDVFHSSELSLCENAFGIKKSLGMTIRENTRKPIIGCGSVISKEKANDALDKDVYDLIAFGRALITNPKLINYFKEDMDFEFIKFDYGQHIYQLK